MIDFANELVRVGVIMLIVLKPLQQLTNLCLQYQLTPSYLWSPAALCSQVSNCAILQYSAVLFEGFLSPSLQIRLLSLKSFDDFLVF